MNLKKLVVITLIVIFGFFLIISFFRLYPYLVNVYYSYHLKKQEVVIKNHKFVYYPIDAPKGILIFILDRRMDHLGNTIYLETNLGVQLAQLSLKNQYLPVFYDRDDANLPPNQFFSIKKLSSQFTKIYKSVLEWNSKFPVTVFAFGDGCIIASHTLLEMKSIETIHKIFLVNCGFTDSLLNYYGNLIFHSMKISRVEEDIISKAQQEWLEWYQAKEYEPYTEEMWHKEQSEFIKQKLHPDLIAFRKTMKNFQKKENISFLKEAKEMFFYKQLQRLIKHKGIQIFYFISEFDEEIPEEIGFELKKKSLDFADANFYFIFLRNTNHLLYQVEKKLESPLEVAIFRNPFGKKFSKDFIMNFEKNL